MAYNFNNNSLESPTLDPTAAADGDRSIAAPDAVSPGTVSPGTVSPGAVSPAVLSPGAVAAPVTAAPATSQVPASAAFIRFRSCRWYQPAENGNQEYCTHREVKPYAGTTGFDPDAWCPDCQYYKVRRSPKKRQPQDEYTY